VHRGKSKIDEVQKDKLPKKCTIGSDAVPSDRGKSRKLPQIRATEGRKLPHKAIFHFFSNFREW
jgi:hypothetical protein